MGLQMTSERSNFSMCQFLLHGCLMIGFFRPLISRIAIVSYHDHLEVTYWPQYDLLRGLNSQVDSLPRGCLQGFQK